MNDYTPPFHLTEEIAELGIEIGELIGEVSVRADLSADPQLRRENRIRSIYSSLAIEQNTLSLDQVTDVINGKIVLGPPKDIREIQNAYEVYEHMDTLDPCSVEDLLTAHRLMMHDLIPDAGCFRSGNVGVFRGSRLIHAGTPADYVPEVMAQLFDWLRTTSVHPLVKGCVFHFEFEYIHPFSDGNGRTGRLWHSLIIQQWRPILAWIPVESMVREHQDEYYDTLGSGQHQGEATAFIAFMLRMLRDTLDEIRKAQNTDVVNNVVNNVVNKQEQNIRAVLAILEKRPKTSANEMAQLIGLSTRQVQRILAQLQTEGKIIRHGSTRNVTWEVLKP